MEGLEEEDEALARGGEDECSLVGGWEDGPMEDDDGPVVVRIEVVPVRIITRPLGNRSPLTVRVGLE